MTPKQKAIELLSQMPEPFKTWALENLERYPLEMPKEPETIPEAVDGSFIWRDTPQGERLWEKVHAHYEYGKPLPELPELPLEYRYEQVVKENEDLKRKVAEFVSKLNTQTK